MTLFLALTLITGVSSDSLTIDACYVAAEANHPLQTSFELHAKIAELQRQNVDVTRLPAFRFGGQATYQSEVPTIPIPGAGGVSHDQYRAAFGVDQVIYAGGLRGAQRSIEILKGQLDRQNVAVEVYRVREQVDIAYFGVLLQQSVLTTLETTRATLAAELRQMTARIQEGVVPAGAADVLEVELIRIDQQLDESRANRAAALSVLSTLIGRLLPDDTGLELPSPAPPPSPAGKRRPEYVAMELGRSVLVAQEDIVGRKRLPQFGVTAEVAYGRPPGQNLFKDSFSPFFSAGFILKWAPFDWGSGARSREALRAQAGLIDAQEEAFTRQLDIQSDQQRRDVARLARLIEQDARIIELRERITAQASGQLGAGVITATEFLLEENAERQARLMLKLHEVQLSQARVRLATTIGV